MRKHREKKNKKQREKQVKNRGFLPSTMEGRTGQMKDLYSEMTVNHINQSLDLMHTSGLPVREDVVKRGWILFATFIVSLRCQLFD